MKALTVRQPWASLIAAGVKTIETRSWSTKYRGPLAIHAGAWRPWKTSADGGQRAASYIDPLGREMWEAMRRFEEYPLRWSSTRPLGAVVATCTLSDVVPMVDECPRLITGTQLVIYGDDRERLDLARPVEVDACSGSWWTVEVSDQLPFGDFTPRRYAWLLEDITTCDPVPAKGRLGLWDWDSEELERG